MSLGYARSAQLRGAWYSSSGKTLTATGMATPLTPKKEILFSNASQYRRAPEIVRQPGQRDVVKDIVSREAFGLTVKDT